GWADTMTFMTKVSPGSHWNLLCADAPPTEAIASVIVAAAVAAVIELSSLSPPPCSCLRAETGCFRARMQEISLCDRTRDVVLWHPRGDCQCGCNEIHKMKYLAVVACETLTFDRSQEC